MSDNYEVIKIERPAEQIIIFEIPPFLSAFGTNPFISWSDVRLKFVIDNTSKSVRAELVANNAYVLWKGETFVLYEQLMGTINIKHVVEIQAKGDK